MRAGTLLCLCIITGLIVTSCESTELSGTGEIYLDLPATKYQYDISGSDSLNAKATLGRVLFYDRQMSINNTIACASCHKQEYGFADNQKSSRGFEGRLTSRNSMPIQNLNNFNFGVFDLGSTPDPGFVPFGNHLFWDGREQNLEKLILQPVGNHIEMGITDLDHLTENLSALPYYAPLFQDAYGSNEVTGDKISRAVSTFLTYINSLNTKFDQYNKNNQLALEFNGQSNSLPILSPIETEGMLLFKDKYDCNACHQVQSPTGYIMAGTFANIGLDADYPDPGLFQVTKSPADAGKFKIPSLRNVAFTAPYMHDGRFENLEDVIDHYSDGIADHPNLDTKLQDHTGHAKAMNISQHEKDAIIAFLHTLSDKSALTDPKFSNPFKIR
jgi:cytochrome c peroxidase